MIRSRDGKRKERRLREYPDRFSVRTLAFLSLRIDDPLYCPGKGCPDLRDREDCYVCPKRDMRHAEQYTHEGDAFLEGAALVRLLSTGFQISPGDERADAVHAATAIKAEIRAQEAEAYGQE